MYYDSVVTGYNRKRRLDTMKVTIKDVAKHAGVSVATVSRYLNNSPLISPDSAEKVRQSMEYLNYHPNFIAKSFANQSSKTIAFIVDSANTETYGNDYFLRIQYGIEHVLGKSGYYVMIINISNDLTGVQDLKNTVLQKRVDGIIVSAELASNPLVTFLNEMNFPFVILGKSSEKDTCWLDLDNTMGGRLATRKLISGGAVKIGFITSSFKKVFVQERYRGYRNALEEAGIDFDDTFLVTDCYSNLDGYQYILSQNSWLDAYVITDNVTAFGVMKGLEKKKIEVPRNIQIVTFDNSIVSVLSDPEMTVIDIDVFQLGMQAATMLISQLDHIEMKKNYYLMPVTLIERGSTK